MKIVIIQNTNPETYPMFEIQENHLEVIKNTHPEAEINIIKDTEISNKAQVTSDRLNEAEVILTTPFSLVALDEYYMDPRLRGNDKEANLKWIHLTSAGVDRLPDSIKQSDILITNSSGVHPIPISEHVFAFILMFARGIYVSYRNQIEKKEWSRSFQDFKPFEIQGKTMGIVGYGRIGKQIAEVAKNFGMKLLTVTEEEGNLEQVLRESDFVINSLPATDKTFHYFDTEQFSLMKKTAIFINTGRGKTVNEQTLFEALKNGVIAGAGIDVTEVEPLSKDSPLWTLNNIIITPHISGWTPEYMNRVVEIFCTNLKAYLNSENMPNLVDKEKGY